MSSPPTLTALLEALRACTTLESAGEILLDALLARLPAQLEGSPLAGATVVHAALHLHDGEGFRAGVRQGPGHPPATPDLPASRTAWEALRERGEPLILDVRCRDLHYAGGRRVGLPPEQQRGGTLTGLRAAAVTHLLAVPLRAPARGLQGFASVALRAPRASGQEPDSAMEGMGELQAVADLGTLVLLLLPPAPTPTGGTEASGVMRALLEQAALLAEGPPVLIRGERGTGRAWLARWIHARSGGGVLHVEHGGAIGLAALMVALEGEGAILIEEIEELGAPSQRALAGWLARGAPGPRLFATARRRAGEHRLVDELAAELTWTLVTPRLGERPEDRLPLARLFLAEHLASRPGGAAVHLSEAAGDALAAQPCPEHLDGLRALVELAAHEARRDATSAVLRIDPVHVRRAAARLSAPDPGILERLRPGARALLEHARATESGLTLSVTEGFAGLVLVEALEAGLEVAEVARLFGLGHQQAAGNHWKTLRSAAEKLRALCAAIGEPVPAAASRLDARWRHRR